MAVHPAARSCLLLFLVLLLIQTNESFADRIYLKSGKVLEGKLRDSKSRSWGHLCEDESRVDIDNGGRIHCIELADIVRVDKILKKPEGTALLAKEENWGESKFGYRTQVIPMSEEFVVGKPMLFGVLLKNDSDTLKWFDGQGVAQDGLTVTGPNGAPVYRRQLSVCTTGEDQPLDTGEIAILAEQRTISEEFLITLPGNYSIQFNEGNYGFGTASTFPKSNVVEFVVQPGQGKMPDRLYERFSSIACPPNWALYSGWETVAGPAGRAEVESLVIRFGYFKDSKKQSRYFVPVWITKTPARADKESGATSQTVAQQESQAMRYQSPYPEMSHFLGRNNEGYFYTTISEQARNDWPGIVDDLQEGLGLKTGNARDGD